MGVALDARLETPPNPSLGRFAVVADLHLRGEGDPHTASFLRFVDSLDPGLRLVVAGDLFQFCFVTTGAPASCMPVLRRLAERVGTIVIEGNHEFHLRRLGLPLEVVQGFLDVDCAAGRVRIGHGDRLGAAGAAQGLVSTVLRSASVRGLATVCGVERWHRLGLRVADRGGRHLPYAPTDGGWLEDARALALHHQRTGMARWTVLGHGHRLGCWDDTLLCPGDWRREPHWVRIDGPPTIERFSG